MIPIKGDPSANNVVMDKVRADKLREVLDGHDGTWVAHPGLIPVAREVFDAHMRAPNQIHRQRNDVCVSENDLLAVPEGPRTVTALKNNINVAIQYVEAWLGGNGCVPLHNLMEDAATAEISRTQVSCHTILPCSLYWLYGRCCGSACTVNDPRRSAHRSQ